MKFGSREHTRALRQMERAAETPASRTSRQRREARERRGREREHERAKEFLARLSGRDRAQLEDQIAEGEFDWRDWLGEPPSEDFWDEILTEFDFLD